MLRFSPVVSLNSLTPQWQHGHCLGPLWNLQVAWPVLTPPPLFFLPVSPLLNSARYPGRREGRRRQHMLFWPFTKQTSEGIWKKCVSTLHTYTVPLTHAPSHSQVLFDGRKWICMPSRDRQKSHFHISTVVFFFFPPNSLSSIHTFVGHCQSFFPLCEKTLRMHVCCRSFE